MTNLEVYNKYKKLLKNPDVDEINIRILLCEINCYETMSDFYTHQNENIKDLQGFQLSFARFLGGEPLQYIIGNTIFYGSKFNVDNYVLIPRQETEEVVDFAVKKIKQIYDEKSVDILDVCTGSGCIGISVAKNVKTNSLILSDISSEALRVASSNLLLNKIDGKVVVSDGLIDIKNKVDILLANPPYILKEKIDEVDQSTLKYEPHLALFTSNELGVYKNIFENAINIKKDGQKLIMIFEIGYDLKDLLIKLISQKLPFASYEFHKDMNGKDRILYIEMN